MKDLTFCLQELHTHFSHYCVSVRSILELVAQDCNSGKPSPSSSQCMQWLQQELAAFSKTEPGYCLAEAYVLRRLHNDRLKRMDEEKAKMDDDDELDLEVNCFLSIFKKVFPARAVLKDGAGKEAQRLDSKV
ncbi:hypothetical protein NC652_037672 [Populus alba x Populus x berolinensis]|nr:hypothetical protein NC652_037672 [Populus alba x Populus x berolinensis]